MAEDKFEAARDRQTGEATLRMLARDADVYVRRSVAENPATPEFVLRTLLAWDAEVLVRRAVARGKYAAVPGRKTAPELETGARRRHADASGQSQQPPTQSPRQFLRKPFGMRQRSGASLALTSGCFAIRSLHHAYGSF
jgi:hypothetical protein